MKNKKQALMAGVFTLIAFSGCSTLNDSSDHKEWSIPLYISGEIIILVEDDLRQAYEIIDLQDYENYHLASVLFRRMYEKTNQEVALWRHLAALTLWMRYEQGHPANLSTIIASGEAAKAPHPIPLTAFYAQQNQRMLDNAREAMK